MTPTSLATSNQPTGLPRGLTLDDALRVAAALDAAHAESTRLAYAHTWRVWERWCTSRGIPPLPADPAALAAYLVERAADGTAVTTLNMACTAIRHMHRQHGLANPAEDELVRQVRLGLRRTYGTPPSGWPARSPSPRSARSSRRSTAAPRSEPATQRSSCSATPQRCEAPSSSRWTWKTSNSSPAAS